MPRTIHFISGLPRAGSTLLAALLRQNPRFHAGVQSPLAEVVMAALRAMSGAESAFFMTNEQRESMLRAMIVSYYDALGSVPVIVDSNRFWCSMLPTIARVLPNAKMICCIRNPAWILDSMERLVQQNSLTTARVFGHDVGTVFTRVEAMTTKQLLGPALRSLKQAWFGEYASRVIAVRYESLADRPQEVMTKLYALLGEAGFSHNCDAVHYEEPEFDSRLGLPGLHRVVGPIKRHKRVTILPPELFAQHDREFWASHQGNPRQVPIL